MAWTQLELDALDQAISSGATSVSYAGRQVSYRSLDEMIRLRNMIRADLGIGTNGGITYQTPAYSKGLTS